MNSAVASCWHLSTAFRRKISSGAPLDRMSC